MKKLKYINGIKNNSSGITLIALVVTIIVLLILAIVSIGMLTGENGIIKQAIESKDKTDIADEKERVELAAVGAAVKNEYGEITEKNLKDELDEIIGNGKYTLIKDGDIFVVTYTESDRSYYVDENKNVGAVVKREGIKVGDYINYIPDENITGYSPDNLTEEKTGSDSNTTTIIQDPQYARDGTGMTWQILRIYANGSMDLIGSSTIQYIWLYGANGYNNGITIMNDICKTLYSKGNISARSIKYEDIEYWLTDKGKDIRDKYKNNGGGPLYGQTSINTNSNFMYYPKLYAYKIGSGIDTEMVKTTGLGVSDPGTATGYAQASTKLTATQTYWTCPINNENFGEGFNALKTNSKYWMASHCTDCYSEGVSFGFYSVYDLSISGSGIYNSNNTGEHYAGFLCPVVKLSPNAQIQNCTGTNGKDNMHKIVQY